MSPSHKTLVRAIASSFLEFVEDNDAKIHKWNSNPYGDYGYTEQFFYDDPGEILDAFITYLEEKENGKS